MYAVEAVTDESLVTLASRLAESAGRGRVRALSRLVGGKNNQVYHVETEAGELVVLKRYFTDPRDPRDRLRAEWEFLQHAWSRGIHAIPEPLACDPAAHAGLYSFVEGRKLLATELQAVHIGAAIDFVLAANARPRVPLAPGSEACFTLAEHIATVESRVARLATLDAGAPHAEVAQSFVSKRLLPAWTTVKSKLVADAQAAGISMEEALDPHDRCLSPSDFGFHNALIDEAGRIIFLDFEYAGSDDPA
ncbi:MAG: aminoglycoside phosphotransferase family protein, partial [Bradyrhizobium sp.]